MVIISHTAHTMTEMFLMLGKGHHLSIVFLILVRILLMQRLELFLIYIYRAKGEQMPASPQDATVL